MYCSSCFLSVSLHYIWDCPCFFFRYSIGCICQAIVHWISMALHSCLLTHWPLQGAIITEQCYFINRADSSLAESKSTQSLKERWDCDPSVMECSLWSEHMWTRSLALTRLSNSRWQVYVMSKQTDISHLKLPVCLTLSTQRFYGGEIFRVGLHSVSVCFGKWLY